MKGVNENRYLLHTVLRQIQELSPVTSAESVIDHQYPEFDSPNDGYGMGCGAGRESPPTARSG